MSRHNDLGSKRPEEGAPVSSCLEKVFFTFFLTMVIFVLAAAGMASGDPAWASLMNGDCAVSDKYPEEIFKWCTLITNQSREAGLSPDLVAALIWMESGGNPKAYSHSGAVGLMQVMPNNGIAATFQCNGKPCFHDRPSITQLQDPSFNVRYGTQMLKELERKHRGNLREALREYGPIDVGYKYADAVLALYQRYGRN